MDEPFFISVSYKGKEYNFETRIVSTGYVHKFHVNINGIDVMYEPDEERKYRAILDAENMGKVKDDDIALIREVGAQIESIRE